MAGTKPTLVEKPSSKKSGPAGKKQDRTVKEPKEVDTYVMQLVEEGPANKHKNIQMKKQKKSTDSSGNIEFTNFSKGGRAKKKKSSGKAIRGKGCEIR